MALEQTAVTTLVPFCLAKANLLSEQAPVANAGDPTLERRELAERVAWATVGASKAPDHARAITGADSLRTTRSGV